MSKVVPRRHETGPAGPSCGVSSADWLPDIWLNRNGCHGSAWDETVEKTLYILCECRMCRCHVVKRNAITAITCITAMYRGQLSFKTNP